MSECAGCREARRRELALWEVLRSQRNGGATVVRIELVEALLHRPPNPGVDYRSTPG